MFEHVKLLLEAKNDRCLLRPTVPSAHSSTFFNVDVAASHTKRPTISALVGENISSRITGLIGNCGLFSPVIQKSGGPPVMRANLQYSNHEAHQHGYH